MCIINILLYGLQCKCEIIRLKAWLILDALQIHHYTFLRAFICQRSATEASDSTIRGFKSCITFNDELPHSVLFKRFERSFV